ncbi:MAG: IclR family transcriptional regulator [Actinomycetota bacterium]|nr:IclR family transcriptional regulator [Actinomycetota bacterium]
MPDEERGKSNYHTHALARGLLVLETVAAQPEPATLGEIHASSGLPKSTIVRLLSALVSEEYLVRVDERPSYRLGHKVMSLANAFVDALSVPDVARPHLAQLASQTRQTANLAVLDGPNVIHVAVEHPDRPLRYDASVGDRAVTFGTGLGKVLLAALPDSEVGAHLPPAPWTASTPTTITTPRRLKPILADVRRQGYAYDDEEWDEGLRCLAVPVVVDGTTLAALSISGAAGEFSDEVRPRFLEVLNRVAGALAHDRTIVAALTSAPRPKG